MTNSSASLTDMAVLIPQSYDGSRYAVDRSEWRNTHTYVHATSCYLPTCDISLELLALPAAEAGEFVGLT
jgi:hypothetical protein